MFTVVLLTGCAFADQIAVGTLEFNTRIVGEDGVGVNAFFSINQTGNGVDFLSTPVVFTNAFLTLYPAIGSSIQYALGDIGPGDFFESDLFAETTTFTSAAFTGTIQGLNWSLSGLLLPIGQSTTLSAGQFALIYAYFESDGQTSSDVPVHLPEPASLALLGSGLAGLAWRRLWAGSSRQRG
jgi:hypothetical protein